jgi:hypothetical protein
VKYKNVEGKGESSVSIKQYFIKQQQTKQSSFQNFTTRAGYVNCNDVDLDWYWYWFVLKDYSQDRAQSLGTAATAAP